MVEIKRGFMRRFRWIIADWLSYFACRLRGHQWTQLPSNYPGIYGNEAAALKDRIWHLSVLANHPKPSTDYLEEIETNLDRLARLAGENWGHARL
jgi:hypothetical protein